MDRSVEARLTALAFAIQRRKMEQAAPADELSRSLMDYEKRLANLDERGKADLLEAANRGGMGLTMRDIERMIEEAK